MGFVEDILLSMVNFMNRVCEGLARIIVRILDSIINIILSCLLVISILGMGAMYGSDQYQAFTINTPWGPELPNSSSYIPIHEIADNKSQYLSQNVTVKGYGDKKRDDIFLSRSGERLRIECNHYLFEGHEYVITGQVEEYQYYNDSFDISIKCNVSPIHTGETNHSS